MDKFPLKIQVMASASEGIAEKWTAKAGMLPPINCAIPPEFMGPGGGYSPEDLFALSVLNCLIATYKVYCEKAEVRFASLSGSATLFVDKQDGRLTMSQMDIELIVQGTSDPAKARKILDDAIRDCPVGNSIKSAKTFKVTVS